MSKCLLQKKTLLLFSSILCILEAVRYSRTDEGYPQGYSPFCPGSWKAAVIKPETLKKLFISVYDKNERCSGSYDYYHMDGLAKNRDMNFKKKTFLWIGGYMSANAWGSPSRFGSYYRKNGYNVISLDTLHFTAMFYPLAARLAPAVGKHTAEMLVKLTRHGLDPKKLDVVGMSLGAQTMSFVAKNYRLITGQNISSLTSLDPTGACFRLLGPDQRLDKSDADFVASVITNADIAGFAPHVSHVTFYVNGGEFQPGQLPWLPCDYLCSHVRAFQLWRSALAYPGDHIAVRCDTVQQARDGDCYDVKPMITNTMGLLTDRSEPGIYYLPTSNIWPYAIKEKGLKRPKHGTDKDLTFVENQPKDN